MTQNKTVNKQS